LGFPGCEVQSVLCFLKGRTSSFLQSSLFVLIRSCLGKITFPPFCKSFFYILTICVVLCWYEVSIGFFFLLFLQCYGVFSFLYCLSSGGIFFFFFLFVGGVSCVFIHLLRSSLVLFILGLLGPRGFSGWPGHIFLLRGAPLCGVSVRYYLFEC
jgi:hypothetical protein